MKGGRKWSGKTIRQPKGIIIILLAEPHMQTAQYGDYHVIGLADT